MANRIWILGAADPEMEAIESLLLECGETVVCAAIAGCRVTVGEAYRADCPAELQGGSGEPLTAVYRVECAWDHSHESLQCGVATIDHHRPGDPGYGAPPAEFLRASSLGQVIAELARLGAIPETWQSGPGLFVEPGDFEQLSAADLISPGDVEYYVGIHNGLCDSTVGCLIPETLIFSAAADHCLGAAYRGECPGVDPDALMRWRTESRAKFQGREVDALLADVAAAKFALDFAERITLTSVDYTGGCTGCGNHVQPVDEDDTDLDYCICPRVADIRGQHVPELPEAGTRYGISYIADGLPGPDGRIKIVCSGTSDAVTMFLGGWAAKNGIVDCYGDPARGFAGGYLA